MYPYLTNDIKISTRLTAAFAFLLLLVVLLGGLALQSIITLNALMGRISDHPLTVIDESQQAKNNVLAIQRDIRDLTHSGHTGAKSLREAADAEKKRVITQLIAAIIGRVILGALITWFISCSIIQPLEELRRRMADLAAGDLSVEIPFQAGSSELAAIARAVQVFKEAVEKLENQRWIKTTISEK